MKIEQGKTYIVRRGYKGTSKIKIIELTKMSVLFQNMDIKTANPERLTINEFNNEHFVLELIDEIPNDL